MSYKNQFYHLIIMTLLWMGVIVILIFMTYRVDLEGITYTEHSHSKNYFIPIKLEENINATDFHNSLSIIITNLGINIKATELAMELPEDIVLGFSPYSPSLEHFLEQSQKKNRISFINLPMPSNNNFKSVGPLNIETSNVLFYMLNRYSHFLYGVYTDPDEIFLKDNKNIESLMAIIKKNNLILCYTGNNNNVMNVANTANVKILRPRIIINDTMDESEVKNILLSVENILKSQKNEKFLLSISASVANLSILRNWLAGIGQYFTLVPIDLR